AVSAAKAAPLSRSGNVQVASDNDTRRLFLHRVAVTVEWLGARMIIVGRVEMASGAIRRADHLAADDLLGLVAVQFDDSVAALLFHDLPPGNVGHRPQRGGLGARPGRSRSGLFQFGSKLVRPVRNGLTSRRHHTDDGDADPGSDQTILKGSR